MTEDDATTSPSAATLHAALLDYYSAPGKYQLSLRQPVTLFASIREILQIAAGRGVRPDASGTVLREAASFFIRAALLYPGADHYAVMGFPFGAEPVDLKERYRLLMRLIHPDFAQAGTAAWPADAAVRVNRANEVLSSPVRRREYEEQLANLKQQRPAGVAKATSHAPAALARRQQKPRLQVGKRAAWGLGIALTGMGILMLMPRQEPDHLVQRKTAAPAVVTRELPRVQEPRVLPPTPSPIAEMPGLPPAIQAAPAPAPQWDRLGQVPLPRPQVPATPRPVPPVAARAATVAPALPAVPPATVPPPLPTPLPPPVVTAVAVAPVAAPSAASPPAPPAAVLTAAPVAKAAPAIPPAISPALPTPTLGEAQPLLTQMLQMLETGSGEQLLRLLEADARQSPGAQALSRNFEQLVKGARPVHLSQVEFKGEPRDGVLLVTGRVRLHAGETTIGSHGQRLVLRAEFASRGGKVMLTNLSGAPD